MSKYYFVDQLGEYWGVSFDRALIKIANIIKKKPDYYLKLWDPINGVKQEIMHKKRYKIDETLEYKAIDVNIKSFRSGIPRITIRDNKNKIKFIRFSSAFFHQVFGENQPRYAKILKVTDNIIKLIFSHSKKDGFFNITKPSKTSRYYSQIRIDSFLNYYQMRINDIIGTYYANEGFKREMLDKNVFYLYIDKREK